VIAILAASSVACDALLGIEDQTYNAPEDGGVDATSETPEAGQGHPDATLDAMADVVAPDDASDAIASDASLDAEDAASDAEASCSADAGDVGAPCGAPGNACNAGGTCVAIGAPRQIAPLSTALATSQKPLFHWVLGSDSTGAEVQICSTRNCSTVLQTFAATGTMGAPASALSAGTYFWRAYGMLGSTIGTAASAVWEFRVGRLSAPVNTSWGTIVDPNGDGIADVVVGAPTSGSAGVGNEYPGAAYVYSSTGDAGLSTSPTSLTNCAPTSGEFGGSVASAGDVNGDGFADVIVGASYDQAVACVYLGGPSGIAETAAATLEGPTGGSSEYVAIVVASAGDVNGDGYADVLVTSARGVSPGSVLIYLGGPGGTSTTPATTLATGISGDGFAFSAAGAGDINGDGYGDVVVGAPQTLPDDDAGSPVGAAYVFLGGVTSDAGVGLTTTGIPLAGKAVFGNFGSSVASADDVNGDGYADVAVGATAGAVNVYEGSSAPGSTNPIVISGAAGAAFGSAVAAAGDVDGDGHSDLVVGAPGVDNASGEAYVELAGLDAGFGTSYPLTNPLDAGFVYFGNAVGGLGDVLGTGEACIAVGTGAGNNFYFYAGQTPSVTKAFIGVNRSGFGDSVE
jgi:hypothetical protein